MTRLDITRGGPGFLGATGKDGGSIAGVGTSPSASAGVEETPPGGGKSGDSMIIEDAEVVHFGGGKSGELIIIRGMGAVPGGGGKSEESTTTGGNAGL